MSYNIGEKVEYIGRKIKYLADKTLFRPEFIIIGDNNDETYNIESIIENAVLHDVPIKDLQKIEKASLRNRLPQRNDDSVCKQCINLRKIVNKNQLLVRENKRLKSEIKLLRSQLQDDNNNNVVLAYHSPSISNRSNRESLEINDTPESDI